MPEYACGSLKYVSGSSKYACVCLSMFVEVLLLHSAFSCIGVLEIASLPRLFPPPLFLWRKGEASAFSQEKRHDASPSPEDREICRAGVCPGPSVRGECQDSLSPGAKTCPGRDMPSPAFLLAALTFWIFAFPLYGRAEGAYLWLRVFSPGLCGGEWPGKEICKSASTAPSFLFVF